MVWLDLTSAEQAAVAELETLPDRAAAIVGMTILETRLTDRLRVELADLAIKSGVTLHRQMFRNSGPLGSFSAQVNLGFMLRLYDEMTWRDLDLIRDIRNDFAHMTEIGSFDTQSVADRCANLQACDLHFKENQTEGLMAPVGSFTGSTAMMHHIFYVRGLAEKLTKPRQRYLLCVMYYAMFLKFHVVYGTGGPGKGQFS